MFKECNIIDGIVVYAQLIIQYKQISNSLNNKIKQIAVCFLG